MEILLLGCSFGVPNYTALDRWGGDFPIGPIHEHTEFRLKSLGYGVHNCSRNAISNLEILSRARQYLSGQPISHNCTNKKFANQQLTKPNDLKSIDWVVWFHTELFRDIKSVSGVTGFLEKDYDIIAHSVYAQYATFIKELDAKLILVGGAGDLHHDFVHYMKPDLCIASWRRHILKKDIPLSNTLWQSNSIDQSCDHNSVKLKIVEDNIVIKQELKNSLYFPDNCHPGADCHRDITDMIHSTIQNSGSSR